MIELAALAVLNSIVNWGRSPETASRTVAADAGTLCTVLSDPACQWRLVEGISPRLRPSAHVGPCRPPRFAHSRVRLAGRDALWLTWILTPGRGTTDVDLYAQIESRTVLARLVLLLGGRRRLHRHLEAVLGTLAEEAVRAAEDLDQSDSGVQAARMSTRSPRKGTSSASSSRRWRAPFASEPSARTTRCHGTVSSSHAASAAPARRGAPGQTSP
jgi:hypothetical protein